MAIDILINNALLRKSKGETTDIAIAGGKIIERRKGISDTASDTIKC